MTTGTTTATELLSTTVRVPQHVVYRSFPAETVLLNLDSGTYHGLNPSGGRMLEALERSPTVAAAAAELARAYEAPSAAIERDLCELCEELLARGLVEIADGAPSA